MSRPCPSPSLTMFRSAIRESPVASASATTDRRTLVALGFGTFVAALVFVIPPLFFPQMARELQVSVPLLGQIMSAMLGLSVVLGLVIGPLSDRSGYRRLILVGLVASAIVFPCFWSGPDLPVAPAGERGGGRGRRRGARSLVRHRRDRVRGDGGAASDRLDHRPRRPARPSSGCRSWPRSGRSPGGGSRSSWRV